MMAKVKTGANRVDNWNFQDVAPWAATGGAGMLGRLMYHAKQVQAGKRKPLSWALFFDLPIAFGMGWIAFGICDWMGMRLPFEISAAIATSYLGPYTVDRVAALAADRYFGKDASE